MSRWSFTVDAAGVGFGFVRSLIGVGGSDGLPDPLPERRLLSTKHGTGNNTRFPAKGVVLSSPASMILRN